MIVRDVIPDQLSGSSLLMIEYIEGKELGVFAKIKFSLRMYCREAKDFDKQPIAGKINWFMVFVTKVILYWSSGFRLFWLENTIRAIESFNTVSILILKWKIFKNFT